jgi:homoserine kinase
LFTITDDIETARVAKQWLDENYIDQALGFSHICQIDDLGARRA